MVNDACLMESRREERVFQLLRMLNLLLSKQKVTGALDVGDASRVADL